MTNVNRDNSIVLTSLPSSLQTSDISLFTTISFLTHFLVSILSPHHLHPATLLLLRNPTPNYALYYPQTPLYDWRKFKFQTPPFPSIATPLPENLDHMFLLCYASKCSILYMICHTLELSPPQSSSPNILQGPVCTKGLPLLGASLSLLPKIQSPPAYGHASGRLRTTTCPVPSHPYRLYQTPS
jgi:hypothetical protein